MVYILPIGGYFATYHFFLREPKTAIDKRSKAYMFPLSKVNVRTGRKGYYKRTQATDKTTAMRIGLHDSDDAIGTDGDLHNRIYSKSTKALNHRDSSIEALDLPFFQLGKHPNQVQPTTAVVQSLPSNPATLF